MTTNPKLFFRLIGMAMAAIVGPDLAGAQVHKPPKAPKSVRLYIFDCGVIHTTNGDAYSLKKEEMASTEMSIPCILVAHPKGTLMWDNGYIPDRAFPPGGGQATSGVVTQDKPLLPQMAAVGYAPGDITYLSMSHYHGDHVANANSFAGATWLVRKVERDRMFSDTPIPRSDPANYSELKTSKNYPEERTLNRLPVADFNKEQTKASRAELEDFLKKTAAQLWIEHDIIANAKLKKAPAFYD
jgi:N-acyl homoserine lactone hydrolase